MNSTDLINVTTCATCTSASSETGSWIDTISNTIINNTIINNTINNTIESILETKSEKNGSNNWWENLPFWNMEPVDWRKTPLGKHDSDILPRFQRTVVHATCGVFIVLGVIGNILLFFIALQPELRSFSYSLYLTALSVYDTVSLVMMSAELMSQMDRRSLMMMPLYRCLTLNAVLRICTTLSPWTLVALSADRLIALVYPMKRRIYCTLSRARKILVLSVVVCILITLPDVILFRQQKGTDYCAFENEAHYFYTPFGNMMITVIPCIFLLSINVRTVIAVRVSVNTRRAITATANAMQQRHTDDVSARRSTVALICLPMISSVIMTPYSAVILYNVFFVYREVAENFRSTYEWEQRVVDAEFYLRIVNISLYACNLYLLLATSSTYRKILLRMLHLSTA